MEIVKKGVSTLKNNWKGALVGGVAGFYVAKKYGKVTNKWALVGIAIGSALLGSAVEYKIKAKTVQPPVSSGSTKPGAKK